MTVVFKCLLWSVSGPEVQLGAKAINFMQIDLGETATRTIDLVNNSDIDAVYQVLFVELDNFIVEFML